MGVATDEFPQRLARLAGGLYLAVIAGGMFAELAVREQLIVRGDAVATATNILANEQLFRWGFVADLVPLLCNMGLTVIFYTMFRAVNRRVAALMALFSLAGTTIQAIALLFHLAPLLLLKGVSTLDGLTAAQLQVLAYLSLRLQANGYTLALVFFGGFGVSIGYLILRSTLLPRFIGALMVIAGLCYFCNSMAAFIAPQSASIAFLLPCLVAEASLTAWLLAFGVDRGRWPAWSVPGR